MFASINNLFDKTPPFSGGGIAGRRRACTTRWVAPIAWACGCASEHHLARGAHAPPFLTSFWGDFMISISRGSSLAAVALAGIGIAGCDSIKDVRSTPATTVPEQMAVLEGTITGLGSKRPVRLNAGITLEGYEPVQYFFGNLDIPATPFSYGSMPVGTSYNFSITQNPFGKVCTVQNGSGSVGGTGPKPSVTCVDDLAVPRYTISGTTAPSFAILPNAAVTLTTEQGVERIQLNGATAFTFTTKAFSAPISNPSDPAASQFLWNVIATYQQDGRTYNCRVLNGAGANPTANVSNVNVSACQFAVTGTVQYSAPGGGAAQPIGAGGLKLALRKLGTAEPPANSELTIPAFAGGTVTFWPELPSFVGAAYDIVVTQNPAGQKCIVRTFADAVARGGPAHRRGDGCRRRDARLDAVAVESAPDGRHLQPHVEPERRRGALPRVAVGAEGADGRLPAHPAQRGHRAGHQ